MRTSHTTFTLLRTDKQNRRWISAIGLPTLVSRLAAHAGNPRIEQLRASVQGRSAKELDPAICRKLHRIYASVRLRATEGGGGLAITGYNDLLMLSIGPFYEAGQMEDAKRLARVLPMTYLVFTGVSGLTLKVFVRVQLPSEAVQQDEPQMEQFFRTAYDLAVSLYSAIIPEPVHVAGWTGTESILMASCRISADTAPYYAPKAAPMQVQGGEPIFVGRGVLLTSQEMEQAETTGLMAFVDGHYRLRHNRIKGCVEYLEKARTSKGWQPADDSFCNGLTISLRQTGLNVWDKDVKRYLHSDRIPLFDPVNDYLHSVAGRWDGCDHIARLAATVRTDLPQWSQWFRMWFVNMVAQWMGCNARFANSLVPLLISPQGYRKSTFCRSLLPPPLRWGYLDNLQMDEKRQVMTAMAEYLLINLDEFNAISAKTQQGFLKNTLQLTTVSVKRPYARRREELPRLASFIATSNMWDVLTDPSGSRRFFVVNLTAPIDTDFRPDYEQLYAQAVDAVQRNEPRWLDATQMELVMQHNRQYEQLGPADMLFHDHFEPAQCPDEGEYLTTGTIYAHLRKQAGATVAAESLAKFGRYLSNLPGIQKRTSRHGTQYLVKRR